MFRYLIDYRNKENNKKLLSIIQEQIDDIEHTLEETEDMRSIDKAYGKSLDYYGDSIGVKRGNYDDETYRLVIKGHKLALSSRGTLDDIARIIQSLLNVDLDEIVIDELYDDYRDRAFTFSDDLTTNSNIGFADINGENGGMLEKLSKDKKSATIEIAKIPLNSLLEIGITVEDFLAIVKKAVASGVALKKVDLSGSFEFSRELVEDINKGFDRGTLGAIFGKENL